MSRPEILRSQLSYIICVMSACYLQTAYFMLILFKYGDLHFHIRIFCYHFSEYEISRKLRLDFFHTAILIPLCLHGRNAIFSVANKCVSICFLSSTDAYNRKLPFRAS